MQHWVYEHPSLLEYRNLMAILSIRDVTCLPAEDSGLLCLVYSCAAEKHNTAPFTSHDVSIFGASYLMVKKETRIAARQHQY